MKLGKTGMKFKSALFITIITVLILTAGSARGQDTPFPTYGSGAVQVRLYTDYFCPPCRKMEPEAEPREMLQGLWLIEKQHFSRVTN